MSKLGDELLNKVIYNQIRRLKNCEKAGKQIDVEEG